MAYTTTNMGLTVWNSVSDLFSHVSLENNMIALDQHNHTSGEGVQIPTGGIANGAITSAKIAAGAVGTAQLAASLLNSFLPSGILLDFAGSTAPTGFLLCDGTAYQQSTYPNLASAIGTTYNIGGEASGYFRVPDHRGLVSVGSTAAGGSAPSLASGISSRSLGPRPANVSGGEETHLLQLTELATHGHTLSSNTTGASVALSSHAHTYGYWYNGGETYTIQYEGEVAPSGSTATIPYNLTTYATNATSAVGTGDSLSDPGHSHTVGNNGSSTAHNNMQPFIVVTKIIKY